FQRKREEIAGALLDARLHARHTPPETCLPTERPPGRAGMAKRGEIGRYRIIAQHDGDRVRPVPSGSPFGTTWTGENKDVAKPLGDYWVLRIIGRVIFFCPARNSATNLN